MPLRSSSVRPSTLYTNRLADVLQPIPVHQPQHAPVDAPRDQRALVDETRVDLHETGAGADHRIRVRRVEDSADADDRQAALRPPPDVAHDLQGAREERTAAKTAGEVGTVRPSPRPHRPTPPAPFPRRERGDWFNRGCCRHPLPCEGTEP